MSREYFDLGRTKSILALKPGARIHVIGVAGVAMAQLAIALTERGFDVSGSDKDFYEPMGSLLRSSKVRLFSGYSAANINQDLDLVIIGNVVSYGQVEVDQVEKLGLSYSLFPQVLFELLINGKHSFVVSGTHGKTTTSALMSSVLVKLGARPAYFTGGVALDLLTSLSLGDGTVSVVEGDEYDSAFFAKTPKFSFYKPDTLIITAVEYDHADIYSSLEAINFEFTKLVRSMPASAKAICCIDYPNLKSLVASWRDSVRCKLITYGTDPEADYVLKSYLVKPAGLMAAVSDQAGNEINLEIALPGSFNLKNALSVFIGLTEAGFNSTEIIDQIKTFLGVKRRQEVRLSGRVVIIEDFAHHPTAVKETIRAIREFYPDRRIWAVFEPRSNTSRKKVFEQEYVSAFNLADLAVLCQVTKRSEAEEDLVDVTTLAAKISANGTRCVALADASAIDNHLANEVKDGDLIVVMSNGSFGGLIDMLVRRYTHN